MPNIIFIMLNQISIKQKFLISSARMPEIDVYNEDYVRDILYSIHYRYTQRG